MTTFTQARDAIVQALQDSWPAAYPTVPVFYDNAIPKDLDLLTEFLDCEIDFVESQQADIGPTPLMRSHGLLCLTLGVKAQSGYRTSLVRADFLSDTFRFSKKQGVNFQAPHLSNPAQTNGWFLTELMVPFFFDG